MAHYSGVATAAAAMHHSGVATTATVPDAPPSIRMGGAAAAPPSAQRAASRQTLQACCAKLCTIQGNWPDRADWKRRPLPKDSRKRWCAKSLPARLEYTQRATIHNASRNPRNPPPASPAPFFVDPSGYTPARFARVNACQGDSAVDDSFSLPTALSSGNSMFLPADQLPPTMEIAWELAASHSGIFYLEDAK